MFHMSSKIPKLNGLMVQRYIGDQKDLFEWVWSSRAHMRTKKPYLSRIEVKGHILEQNDGFEWVQGHILNPRGVHFI